MRANNNLYPRTGKYRELCSTFDLFFDEVRLTYGREFCREMKREALVEYSKLGEKLLAQFESRDMASIDEVFSRIEGTLDTVKLRHPEIYEHMQKFCTMIIGAAA